MQTSSVLRPRAILLLLIPLLLAACTGTVKAPAVKAPAVLQGDFRTHDPSIIRQDSAYYVFSAGDEGGLNHGTIQVRRSSDLANWELVGTVFPDIPEWIGKELGRTPPNLWAPDISFLNGKY